ncbi:MAG TPA: hypothetical protein VGO00_21145, partial [Kofleriaceae bacterium]|nr:hypothetical protein [Kofleriaceae bacterium]
DSILLSGSGLTITYDTFEGGANNDCPDPMAPAGVVSITVEAKQPDGTPADFLTFCIPRIDQLSQGGAFGGPTSGDIRFIDVDGTSGSCTISLDATTPPTGTASTSGVCANGTDPAGFALTLDGTISIEKNCAGAIQLATMTLSGTVAVLPQ